MSFSILELPKKEKTNIAQSIIKGSYPPLYDQPIEAKNWYPNYIRTYIERDVRLIKNISNLDTFDRFIKLCAGRVGQLLNINNLAMETDVDNKTISSWLGILENSFIIFWLKPHYQNFNKRIVKMPKLYFYDTGLVYSLLGFQNVRQLSLNPYYGALFENLIISDIMKQRFNQGKNPNLYFWRDNTGHEIDVIIENGNKLFSIEIKSGKTITSEFFKGLTKWQKLSGIKNGAVIYA